MSPALLRITSPFHKNHRFQRNGNEQAAARRKNPGQESAEAWGKPSALECTTGHLKTLEMTNFPFRVSQNLYANGCSCPCIQPALARLVN